MNKSVISLFKEAIKNKESLSKVSEDNGLGRHYLSDFHRRIDRKLKNGLVTKKEHETIKDLFKKHQQTMNKTKGSNVVEKDELEEVKAIYHDKSLSWDERMTKLKDSFGKSERTVRRWLVKLGLKEKVVEESEQWKLAQVKEHNKKKKRFLISSAQNETPIHKKMLANMESYAKFIGAEILIVPIRYKNPTSVFEDSEHDNWSPEIEQYLCANRLDLHKYLTLLGDIKTQATSSNPLVGMESISGEASCIIGSPRMHMLTVPVIDSQKPKLMLTTGSISMKNYTDSKIGKSSEFHHTYGFVVVEIENDDIFHVRQVTTEENGNFQDLFFKINNNKITKIKSCEGIIPGDIHLGETDEVVMNAVFKLTKQINPKNFLCHDLFTAYSINPHEAHDAFSLIARHQNKTNILKDEIDNMLSWLGNLKKIYKGKIVVVYSNHDDMLTRYIKNTDFKKDIGNALEYLKLANALANGKAPKGLVAYLINEEHPDIKTLGIDESYKVLDWELGIHSHLGANGSKGSIQQYRKLNFKCVIGHGHAPKRLDGCVMTGVCTPLRVSYNHGPSGWLNAAVILHDNSKTQIVNIIEGKYTTLK
jgi:hypothetical protein